MPRSVWATSGWNWTPYRPRSGSSNAATGDASVLATTREPGPLDPAANGPWHGLLAVAEPKHRDAQLEQARVEAGRAQLVDRLGAAGEDQGLGVMGPDRRRVDVAGHDLGEDVALADAAGDELGVLGAEVEHQDGVVAGGRSRHGRRTTNSRNRLLARLAQEYRGAERGSAAPWCLDLAPHTECLVCGAFLFSGQGAHGDKAGGDHRRHPDPPSAAGSPPGGRVVWVGPDLRRRPLPDPAVARQPRQLLLGPPRLGPPGGHPPPPRRGRRRPVDPGAPSPSRRAGSAGAACPRSGAPGRP